MLISVTYNNSHKYMQIARNKSRKKNRRKFLSFCTLILFKSRLFAAHYSSDVLEGSRVIIVTDILNSSIDVEKLYSSLEDRSIADVDFLILQRDGRKSSQGSYDVLSRGKHR